jgi:hypothetical protein
VWEHDRQLERDVVADRSRPQVRQEGNEGGNPIGAVAYGDVVEEVTVHRSERLSRDAMRARAEANYAAMVRWLRGAGIAVAFIEYPINLREFATANAAMRSVAAGYDVPIVRSEDAVARLSQAQRRTLWAAHPNVDMYHEIVLDLGPLVLAARAARG